jgi:CxxC motif-containing protein (DUF1111 family)
MGLILSLFRKCSPRWRASARRSALLPNPIITQEVHIPSIAGRDFVPGSGDADLFRPFPIWRIGTGLKCAVVLSLLLTTGLLLAVAQGPFDPAPTGFDNFTNGAVMQSDMDAGHAQFIQIEQPTPDGLGPLFNAVSCVDCHQSIADGGASQVRELRAGHLQNGQFVGATITLGDGVTTVGPRSLIDLRAITPDALGQLGPEDNIRALRLSLSLFGDAFVEAVADADLIAIAQQQIQTTHGRVHGEAIMVPILENTGTKVRVGRFGWKDQQASLLSFASDAYLNEMGVTNPFNQTEVTTVGNPPGIQEPNNTDDIFSFTTFMRGLKAPPQNASLAVSTDAQAGAALFHKIGCATCHVPALNTVAPGTVLNDGTYTVSDAIGNKTIHPFGDFLLHDIGTGDGIVQNGPPDTRNKVRTMPLWGIRTRVEFLHDGRAHDLYQAIQAHENEADQASDQFGRLSSADKARVIAFLKSL